MAGLSIKIQKTECTECINSGRQRVNNKILDWNIIRGLALLKLFFSMFSSCQDYKKWTQLFIIFFYYFHFLFNLFSYFLFIELRDRVDWSQITRYRGKGQKVPEQSDIIQHGYHMLTSYFTHGYLGQGAQQLAQTICTSI